MEARTTTLIVVGLVGVLLIGYAATAAVVPEDQLAFRQTTEENRQAFLGRVSACIDAPLLRPLIQRNFVASFEVKEHPNGPLSSASLDVIEVGDYQAIEEVAPKTGISGQVDVYTLFAIKLMTVNVLSNSCSVDY